MTNEPDLDRKTRDAKRGKGLRRIFHRQRMEYWAQVAHIVNAIAITATLIFVGLELHDSAVMGERANSDASIAQVSAMRLAIVENRDVANLLINGERDDPPLDAVDQERFDQLLTTIVRVHWGIWERERIGLIPEGSFTRSNGPPLVRTLSTAGGARWWSLRKLEFPVDYVRNVDRLLAAQPKTNR